MGFVIWKTGAQARRSFCISCIMGGGRENGGRLTLAMHSSEEIVYNYLVYPSVVPHTSNKSCAVSTVLPQLIGFPTMWNHWEFLVTPFVSGREDTGSQSGGWEVMFVVGFRGLVPAVHRKTIPVGLCVQI